LILPLTMIVVIIAAVSGLITVRSQERQLLNSMILGADQLSRGIASATWHAMLADNRDAAYSVMQTIAEKQSIDRIRIFNRDGVVMYSTAPGEAGRTGVNRQRLVQSATRPWSREPWQTHARERGSPYRRTSTARSPW
jgi:hypothetical protein